MEITKENEKTNIKKKRLIENLISIKDEFRSNNYYSFSNSDLLFQINAYIDSIQNLNINININNIKIQNYLTSLMYLSDHLDNNLANLYEEKNYFYLNYNEFNKSIQKKLSILKNSKNILIKKRKKIADLLNNYLMNKELNLSMNINNINSIEECLMNPIFNKYIDSDISNNIRKINNIYDNYIKNYKKYNNNLIEVNIINKEFINKIKKCDILCKDMKKKYICNKYMKNN